MSRKMLVVALSALTGLALSSFAPAADYQPVEERMSARDFRASGLDKLSAEELDNLNRWLNGEEIRIVGSAPAGAAETAGERTGPGFERGMFDDQGSDTEVVSYIDGRFDGWQGKNEFRLQNGQVWRQIERTKFVVGDPITNPKVTITRGFTGVWRLQVDGYNTAVKVERVQ
ncbi:hypothetical protein C7S18_05265 [Ahniella affigens]|uniref:Secreted protein n=1 Tax=Ahniella affigens TaxID=2021234 RepID=A0A2P1PP81_9GAMM|nr:hypothetical protein [Ahniella affigens]AVP96648.1 hypothetical protein C7S18_05265 [Ahniella affigens]